LVRRRQRGSGHRPSARASPEARLDRQNPLALAQLEQVSLHLFVCGQLCACGTDCASALLCDSLACGCFRTRPLRLLRFACAPIRRIWRGRCLWCAGSGGFRCQYGVCLWWRRGCVWRRGRVWCHVGSCLRPGGSSGACLWGGWGIWRQHWGRIWPVCSRRFWRHHWRRVWAAGGWRFWRQHWRRVWAAGCRRCVWRAANGWIRGRPWRRRLWCCEARRGFWGYHWRSFWGAGHHLRCINWVWDWGWRWVRRINRWCLWSDGGRYVWRAANGWIWCRRRFWCRRFWCRRQARRGAFWGKHWRSFWGAGGWRLRGAGDNRRLRGPGCRRLWLWPAAAAATRGPRPTGAAASAAADIKLQLDG
jgi:hypothetical protein